MSTTAGYVLWIYREDKVGSLLEVERQAVAASARRLDSLLQLASAIDPAQVQFSRELILLVDQPCRGWDPARVFLSRELAAGVGELLQKQGNWLAGVVEPAACLAGAKPAGLAVAGAVTLLPSGPALPVTHLVAWIRTTLVDRIVFVSMEDFRPSASNTLFIADETGKPVWAVDGEPFMRGALQDLRITDTELQDWMKRLRQPGDSAYVQEWGDYGIVSYRALHAGWAMFSLSYRPAILAPLYSALAQVVALCAGFLFLCLLGGRFLARGLSRPLVSLRESAERISAGDYSARFKSEGHDEVAAVFVAFNRMAERIAALVEATREKATLEQELALAKRVQALFIPAPELRAGPMQLSSYFETASQCGGDWWSAIEIPRPDQAPALVIMIGDVEGHGTASALVTASMHGAVSLVKDWIRARPDFVRQPHVLNEVLNRAIFDATHGTLAMTFQIHGVDPTVGKIWTSNAGHPSAYRIRRDPVTRKSDVRPLGEAGELLGTSPSTRFPVAQENEIGLQDLLLLYSDGLVEGVGSEGRVFDRKDFRKLIRALPTDSPSGFLKGLLSERVRKLVKPVPEDDVTAIVAKLVPVATQARRPV